MSGLITPLRIAMAAMLLCLTAAARPAFAQDYNSGDASYQQFYDELSPYGEWIDDPQNGYVWVPEAGDDFRPYYTNGYWTNTDYGNTWVSDYSWGWAPFHYGRWTYSNYYGWVWIPGNEWGPAWVSWRSGGGCYGWAPLGPGVSVNVSFGSNYYVPDYWWTFTPQQYVLNQHFHQYSYGPRNNNTYIHQTTIINNTYVNNHNTYIIGPRRAELERATGRPVRAVAIANTTRPDRSQIRGNSLSIYRPAIAETRPRSTERPRQFRTAEQPLSGAPRNNMGVSPDRNGGSRAVRDGGQEGFRDRNPQTVRPVPSGSDGAIRQSQPMHIDRQPDRAAELQQPQRGRTEWNGGNRMPDRPNTIQQPQRAEIQQQQQAPPVQHYDRTPINRGAEAPRMQPAQPMPQRAERPVIEQRQPMQPRTEAPRMESPRPTPQRESPAVQPSRNEGGDGRLMRR